MGKINQMHKNRESVVILSDIRSALNVGSIFRTCDAAGVSKIYLVGYTPRPNDQFGRIQKDIAKSALGAELSVLWEYKKTLIPLISKLKKDGYTVVALEQDQDAVDYRKYKAPRKIAIILGPEVTGLPPKILHTCDDIVYIPMYGTKESLNISVACGIALFGMIHQ